MPYQIHKTKTHITRDTTINKRSNPKQKAVASEQNSLNIEYNISNSHTTLSSRRMTQNNPNPIIKYYNAFQNIII